jgi:hypothetical protein
MAPHLCCRWFPTCSVPCISNGHAVQDCAVRCARHNAVIGAWCCCCWSLHPLVLPLGRGDLVSGAGSLGWADSRLYLQDPEQDIRYHVQQSQKGPCRSSCRMQPPCQNVRWILHQPICALSPAHQAASRGPRTQANDLPSSCRDVCPRLYHN